MGFLATFRSDQIIGQLIAEQDPASPAAQKLVTKLKSAGSKAVPKIIDALAMSDKTHTMVLVDILGSMVNDKNLPLYKEGLADGNERVVSGTAWALSSSTSYNANNLLDFFEDEEVSKPALIEVLRVHKQDLSVHELLRHAYECEPKEKAAIFKIIQETIKPEMIPDLIARMGGKDPVIKIHLMQLLAKFDKAEITHAMEMQLKDPNKMVRAAALSALATRPEKSINIAKVAEVLTDPDLDVQSKAVDVLIRINHPNTVKYLIPALKDESEYSRRAAVEVLNEVGNESSVKDLLAAIKDADWWVRSRAGDALAEIGGPRVVDSVLKLVTSKDEEIRRSAIEILNATKDERAVDGLINATDDTDWWVRERAVDALSKIGSPKALPKLESMLGADPKTDTVVIRALGKMGNAKHISKIVPMLQSQDRAIQIEAIKALSHLADDAHAETIRTVLKKIKQSDEYTIVNAADTALKSLDDRYSETVIEENVRAEKIGVHTKTLLLDNSDLEKLLGAQSKEQGAAEAPAAAEAPTALPVLDIAQLNPGDIIDGRYKYIEKIGKGAFGTVLLMHDEVVDEQLILKFLNPNVSSDEEMMKRFVHELRYSRKITHRNVIRIYDFLHLQGAYAISMEYFPSHTLSGEIPDSKPMDLKKALKYSRDMATGMTVAHLAGVIHRDLKPANILVNDEGLLKIVDFGVAAAASSGDTQLTKTGYVIGSPKYMAPEQILGKKVDQTADIYSVGVIMYEMVTGIPPYSRGDHMSVMYQHVQGKAKHCQEINPDLPDDYAELIIKAMSVDKTKRHQSMEELTEGLDSINL
ncbi:MAG TPA: HEAT repeat domain-containing protein [Woeseiaceae bacterium]|nr:HEAT repeat domain-containing protein [Woeseiaceae bacterium]